MGERRGVYWVLMGKPEGRYHLGYSGVDGRIILRWFVRKWNVGVWTGSSWLRIGTGSGHCSNEHSGFIKCREFLDWLKTC
jgi:hypothetical protein